MLRLPRACGYMLIGAMASPLLLRLLQRTDLDPWKPMLDLAIAVLVFELGSRIRPRWLVDNPLFALTCVLEGAAAGVCVSAALVWLGAPMPSAWVAGAVAMSTSPVITMAVLHEARPRGQVTERLLMMTAVNSVLAMLALKVWRRRRVGARARTADRREQCAWSSISGSFLLGAACALLLDRLSRPDAHRARHAGAADRAGHHRQPAGGALDVCRRCSRCWWPAWSPASRCATPDGGAAARLGRLGARGAALHLPGRAVRRWTAWSQLWPWVLAIIAARGCVGKAWRCAAGTPERLGWRQAAALTWRCSR